jgi:hypothetical protein
MTATETERKPIGGWCTGPPGAIPPHGESCKFALCRCPCHDKTKDTS